MAPLRTFLLSSLLSVAKTDDIDRDGVSLLQALSVKGQQRGEKKSVSALVETASNMLKNGATEDVVLFAQATLDEIRGEVIPSINRTHWADQAYLNAMYAPFGEALTQLVSDNERLFEMNLERVRASDDHKECREEEAVICDDKRKCDYELWELWKIFVDEEEDLRRWELRIDGHWCAQDEDGYYIANGTTWPFRDAAPPMMWSFIEQWSTVQISEERYSGFRHWCVSNYTHLDEKTDFCDAAQARLERASCQLAHEARRVHNDFAEAWNTALMGYNTTVHYVKLQELDRIREYRTLEVVQCLLERTHDRNGHPCDESTPEFEEEFTYCERVRITTDITWLYLEYHIVERHPNYCEDRHQYEGCCLPQVPNSPCSGQYITEEYEALDRLELLHTGGTWWPTPPFHEPLDRLELYTSGNSHCNPRADCMDCEPLVPEIDIGLCPSYWSLNHYETSPYEPLELTVNHRSLALCGDTTTCQVTGPPVTNPPEPQCGALPELVNAEWMVSIGGSILQYRCLDGFSFDGSAFCGAHLVVECLPSGLYTDVHPCLPIDDCPGHHCGAHGTCVDLHMDYTCDCSDGFEIHEEHGEKICGNVDDCEGTMCGEAGVCVDLIQDYECHCNTGWEQVVDSDESKTCARLECGTAPVVDNVVPYDVHTGNFPWTRQKAVFGDTVEYLCEVGHSTTGQVDGPRSFSIQCQADQTFTEVQQCVPISCGVPHPAGGAYPVLETEVSFGDSAEYLCPHGFAPSNFLRQCLDGGLFSPAIACEPLICPSPPLYPSTRCDGMNDIFHYGESLSYECEEGYSIDAEDPSATTFSLECHGTHWASHPGCYPVACHGETDETHAGAGTEYTLYYGDMNLWFMCADGHTVDGTAQGSTFFEGTCDSSGVAHIPSCARVTCPEDELMIALYSNVRESRDYLLDEFATYECNEGYAVANTGSLTFAVQCLRSGVFSSMSTCRNIDDCEGHSCGSNGYCVDGINDYTCNCESGFVEETLENGEKLCGNINDCGENQCGGHGMCHDLVNGYECECDVGYEVDGDGIDEFCVKIQCPIPSLPNTVAGPEFIEFGDSLYVACVEGHEVVGVTKSQPFFMIHCGADGNLDTDGSSTLPQCTPVSCGEPPSVLAEQVDVRPYYFGEVAVSVCQGGEVSITHECGSNGQFTVTSQFTTCQNSCGLPAVPDAALRTDGANAVFHPSSAEFSCVDGYTTSSGTSFSQSCRADGTYVDISVSCEPVVCPRPVAPPNWQWLNPSNPFDTQNSATLYCAPGYHSDECGATGEYVVTCDSSGAHSSLPVGGCVPDLYPLYGRIQSALTLDPIHNGQININGQLVHSQANGNFNLELSAGTHTYEITASNFITITGSVTVGPMISQFLEISLSPDLDFNQWRIVLNWGDSPRDLDSHIEFIGGGGWWNSCDDMYYGRKTVNCRGMTASLDVDDVNGNGPETTTLSNMNDYIGTRRIVYKVKNYSGSSGSTNPGWIASGAEVQLYNGDVGLVARFPVDSDHGHRNGDQSGRCYGNNCFWSLFSIDSEGNFEMCNNHLCA